MVEAARRLLALAPAILLLFYAAELILNRTIFRLIVFIPPGPAQQAVGEAVSTLGLAALNAVWIASFIVLASALAVEADRVLRVFYASALLLAVANIAGLVGLHWLLIALAPLIARWDPRRGFESIFMLLMVLSVVAPSTETALAANLAWLALPLAHIAMARRVNLRRLAASLPFAAVALAFAARDPYIASQVLVFAMGLLSPWYLPIAIPLYAATGSRGMMGLLLTGPGLQLSIQPLAITALYASEITGGSRGGEAA